MRHESIPVFKEICERPLAVVDLGREELRRLAQVNEGVQSALASAANICQSGRLSLGPFLRSVAAQMTDAIQQSKRRQASYRHLRRRVEAMTRSVGAVAEAVGMQPIPCSICFENGRHARCSCCDTAACAGCYGRALQEKLHNGTAAEWEKFSKYGCLKPQCPGTVDIRTSLSDEAGRCVLLWQDVLFVARPVPPLQNIFHTPLHPIAKHPPR